MSITFSPDLNLFVTILLALYGINSVCKVGLGIGNTEKSQRYSLYLSGGFRMTRIFKVEGTLE